MSLRTHAIALALAAGCLAAGLSGCASSAGGSGDLGTVGAPAGSTGTGTSTPPADTTTPPAPATSTPTTHKPAVPALTCNQLKGAQVGSTTVSYNGYHDSIPLGDGMWSGEDGNTVTLAKPCGIGDLDGDGAKDAVGAVVLTSGGTGEFWTLVVWHNDHGNPVCVAVADFADGNDRTPVQSISISGGETTVVYLTRTPDAPMAQLNIKRTATYKLVGGHFEETGHLDVTYSGP
jgi:hypothetical protein